MVNTIFIYVRYALDAQLALLNVERIRGRSGVSDQLRNMRGSAVVEYGVMAGIMATAFAGTVGLIGGWLSTLFHGALMSFGG